MPGGKRQSPFVEKIKGPENDRARAGTYVSAANLTTLSSKRHKRTVRDEAANWHGEKKKIHDKV